MNGVSRWRVRLVAVGLCAGVWLGSVLPAAAQMARKLTFDEMVKEADSIVVGTCVERQSVFQNGHIVTKYKIKPSECWKGQPRTNRKGEIEMEELGGQLSGSVPLAQAVPGMADMLKDEEVLLFCGQPKPQKTRTGVKPARTLTSPDSPYVMGAWQGRFSVMRHPQTGERLAVKGTGNTAPGAAIDPNFRRLIIEQNQAYGVAQQVGKAKAAGQAVAPAAAQVSEKFAVGASKLGTMINEAAQKARLERDAQAAKVPEEAGAIHQFESLEAIKGRVFQTLRKAQ